MELINIKTNKFQTPLTEELKEALPREVWEELIDSLTSIKFIQNLIAPEEVRGYAKDRPKEEDFYNDGRIKVDITNPHILEDMDFFRERAIFFSKHGKYTHLIPNGNPKSEYAEFWREELRRWKDGLIRPSDGEWIPGSLYFYWNYVNIWLVEEVESQATNTRRKRRGERIRNFPKVWLGDYLFFHYFEQAMNEGRHIKVLKTRGCGVSFKMASVSPRNMYVYPGSGNSNYHLASDRGFLTGDKGIWGKILDNLDWIAEHTPLPKMRLVDKRQQVLELQLGYSDEYGVRKGLLSSVHGISLKDNPDKARGIRGKLIHYEEDGLFPHLEKAWGVNRKAVEDGDVNFGVMAALGTGGVMGSSFEGSEKLFYNPLSFNIHGLPNVYDRNSHGETICGFFWGAYLNRNNCFDTATGEPDIVKALVEILLDRYEVKYNSTDLNAITQKKAEEPCIVGDTFISNHSIGSNKIIKFDNKFNNGIKPVYEFKLESGRTLHCTKNHKVFNGDVYKNAEHYKPGDKVKLKPLIPNEEYQTVNIKGNFNFDSYDIVINEEWGRFLGLYLGDGSFYNSSLRIDFDTRDVESFNWCKYFFEKYFGKYKIKNWNGRNMISVQTNSTHLKELFIQMDLIEKGNSNKHGYKRKVLVPDYIMNSPKSVISEYLKGYFDADSGIYSGLKNIKIHCKQLENLKRIQYLLTAFDIFANIKTEHKKNGNGRDYIGNSLVLRSWEVDRFKQIGYISEHKQNLLNKWTSYVSKTPIDYDIDTFKSLTYLSEQPVYDIQTEEHCYSANGIWVHNCTPQEAVMRTTGTIFPVADIKEYMEEIGPRKEAFFAEHHVGELVSTSNGDIIFKEDITKVPLRKYHLDGNMNKTGAVEIFEMPKRTAEGVIVRGRYLAGADTIDSDTGGSLFSMFVFDTFTKRIVAEYTGRPRLASEAYEISLRLVKFYNAELNYENNLKGLFTYYDNANALHYLCDTPQILRDMDLVKGPSTYGNAKKGTRANKEINSYGRLLYAEYLINPAYNQDNKLNLHTMRSWGALEETIYYNSDGNFDRISALGMLFILVADRVKRTQSLSSREDTPVSKLANDPFFTKHFKSKNAIDTDFENKNNSF